MTDYKPFEPRPHTPGFIYYEPPTGEPQLSNELRVHVFDHGLLRIWARHADRPNYRRPDSAIVDVFPEHAAEFAARLTEALGIDDDRAALAAQVSQLREQLRVTRLVGEDEKQRAAYEAMDTERRSQESRRAVDNVNLAEVKRLAKEVTERLTAERDAARAEAKRWHDTYQEHANTVDAFFAELLELLPGATDTGSDAYDQIPRGIERIRAERDTALAHVQRLMANRDAVARAVRSPSLTDAEKLQEIREAFAVVDGERAEAGEDR